MSKRTRLEESLISTGFPFRPGDNFRAYMRMFAEITQRTAGVRRPGAAALDLAYVAAGRLDGYFERGLKPWDHAAGALLVQEAGGRVSRIDRESPRPFLIAGGVTLHDRLRDILDEEKP